MPEAESGHEEPRKRLKMETEMEPETNRPKESGQKLQQPFYLSLFPQLTLKILFLQRGNFRLMTFTRLKISIPHSSGNFEFIVV